MPIGYIVGNSYRIDTNYDRYAALPCWKPILAWMTKRSFGVEIKYSHVGRNYTGEVKEMMRFEKSAQLYLVSRSLKSAPDPLSAMMRAIEVVVEKDDLLRVLFLEAECYLLRLALEDWRVQEKKLTGALDTLRTVIDAIPITFMQGEDVLAVTPISQLRGKPVSPGPLAYNEGDTAEDEEWRYTMSRDPYADLDDDL